VSITAPELDSLITGSSNELAVGAEADAIDPTAMGEGLEELPLTIPEFNGFVITGRGNGLVVGTETDAIDIIVKREGFEYLPGTVPE
jgi:hypothetical protein